MPELATAAATTLDIPELVLAEAIGVELRRARKAKGWDHKDMVHPDRGGSVRLIMLYEQGKLPMSMARFAEFCVFLDADPSTVMRRAIQRTGYAADRITLEVDLHALLQDDDPLFLHPWARHQLNNHHGGYVVLSSTEVYSLSQSQARVHLEVATYLAQFCRD